MSATKIHMRGPTKRGESQTLCPQGRGSRRISDDWQRVTCLYCIRPHLAKLAAENQRLRDAVDRIDDADFAGENCCFCGGPVVLSEDGKVCGVCGATEELLG